MRHRRVQRPTRWRIASAVVWALVPMVSLRLTLGTSQAASGLASLEAVPSARPSLPPLPVSLGEFVTTDTRTWGDVPSGAVACDDVPFLCQGAIRLAGLRSAREGKRYPGAVWGVPVQRQGRRIHLLQAAENWSGTASGIPYGKVVLHYLNGEERAFYLLFRVHGLDWYGGSQTPEESVADPNTKLCWAFRKPDGSYRRFFHTVLTNPLPEVEIVSADFVSPLGSANLWVFGLTLSDDRAPLAPLARTSWAARLAPQRTFLTLRLEDAAGQRVTNGVVAWQVIGSNYRVEFPPQPVDAQGWVVLDLPRRLPASISYSVTGPRGARAGGLIEREDAGDFPREILVKLGTVGVGGIASARLAPAPPDRPSTFHPIDLRPQSRKPLDAYKTNQWWSAYPRGPTNFEGVPFVMGGKIELFGTWNARTRAEAFPHEVEFKIGRRFARLHCLQAPLPSAAQGEPYLRLTLRYADGKSHVWQLLYGVHGRDPWRQLSEQTSTITDPNTSVVWTGNSIAITNGATLRLYKTVLENPRPEAEVTNLLCASLETKLSANLLGFTLEENPALDRPAETLEPKDSLPWRDEMAIRVVAAENDRALPEAKVFAWAREDNEVFPVGRQFRRDDAGRSWVPYAPERYAALSYVVCAPGYAATWETVEGVGGVWPREQAVKLAPGTPVGGTVKDADGQALRGVVVRIYGTMPENLWEPPPTDTLLDEVTTDAEGRWLSHCIPATRTEGLRVQVVREGDAARPGSYFGLQPLRERKADLVVPR